MARPVMASAMTTPARTLLAAAMLLAPAGAGAQSGSMTLSRSGPFAIDYVVENGRFDRCAATLSPGPAMLRIAYTKDLAYSISVPGVGKPVRTITFLFGSRPWAKPAATDPKGLRAWSAVGTDTIDALMKVTGTIAIDLDTKQYRWPIGITRMEDVMVALETCTHKAMGR